MEHPKARLNISKGKVAEHGLEQDPVNYQHKYNQPVNNQQAESCIGLGLWFPS